MALFLGQNVALPNDLHTVGERRNFFYATLSIESSSATSTTGYGTQDGNKDTSTDKGDDD